MKPVLRKVGKILLAALVIVVGLPLLLAVVAFVWISALDDTNGTVTFDGGTRDYLIHVPPGYDPSRPTPLVLSFHAGYLWPAQQMHLSHWNRLADENRFLVVYPSGSGFPSMWHTFRTGPALETDVRYVAALIDTLEARYDVDPTRIYVNGISNGGGMAYALACRLSDRVAALATVAAAQSLPADWCRTARPVPLIAFHGTADPLVPYGGGPLGDPFNPVKPVFPAARDFVAGWARRDGCADAPAESRVAPDVVRLEYLDCAGDAAVALYTVEGGGHTWPGGKPMPSWWVGRTTDSIDATREMWTFFRAHPLPGVAR